MTIIQIPQVIMLDPAITDNDDLKHLAKWGYQAIVEEDVIIAWRN